MIRAQQPDDARRASRLARAEQPFQFFQMCRLTELTGRRATTLPELRDGIAGVPASSILHHTHHAFLRAHRLGHDFTNEFALWVSGALQEFHLGERLGGVDVLDYSDMEELRQVFLRLLDEHLGVEGGTVREAPPGEPFHLIVPRTILYPLDLTASTVPELAEGIAAVPVDSIFFHFFEARLRNRRETNDFSHWLEAQLGERELARSISNIDPYVLSLEELRGRTRAILESSGGAATSERAG